MMSAAAAIFDYNFFDFLSQNQNSSGDSLEQDVSYIFDSGGGVGGGQLNHNNDLTGLGTELSRLENVYTPEDQYFYQSGINNNNDNIPGESVSAMAAINSTLSTISNTLGVEQILANVLSSDFSSNVSYFNDNSSESNNTIISSTATYYETTFAVDDLTFVTNGGHDETTPLLKIASSVIPENFRKLSANSRNCVIAYVILFCIGAPGNLFVFLSVGREIWRRQLMRSRIKVLIWHLATADLVVTFVVIPIEVFWRLTIQWYGGDALCKLAQFFRAFGLYLSSMVIICISLDRFFAIVFPLKVIGGMKRVRNMLCIAWGSSILFALPQILVFSVQRHPIYPSFLLCSNSDYFIASLSKEIMYNLLSLTIMYFAPLLVIIVTYAMVLYTIARKSREHHQDCRPRSGSNQLRRSDNASNITRARRKTLWLSMTIVSVFICLWSPFTLATLWYMFDFETAEKMVDPQIHEAFFVTAVSNSCVNPIIYGNYMKRYWKHLKQAACRSRNSSTSSSRIASSSRANNHSNHLQRAASSYRCTNPNHHYSLSPLRHSSGNSSDGVTIVLKEFTTCQLGRSNATSTTLVSSNPSRANWFL